MMIDTLVGLGLGVGEGREEGGGGVKSRKNILQENFLKKSASPSNLKKIFTSIQDGVINYTLSKKIALEKKYFQLNVLKKSLHHL